MVAIMTLASLASRTAAPKRTPTRPLKAATSHQHRTIWQSSRQTRGPPYSSSICWIRADRKLRRRMTHPNADQKPSFHPHEDADPWRAWSPGSGLFSSRFGFGSQEWFEKERTRAEQRMEQIKREIEADPYAALFGRRLEQGHSPFRLWGKHQRGENSLGELWKDVFGVGKGAADAGGDRTGSSAKAAGAASTAKMADTTGHVKSNETGSPSVGDEVLSKETLNNNAPPEKPWSYMDPRAEDLEFDPISGRMAPKGPTDAQTKDLDFDPITGRMIPKGDYSAGDVSHKGIPESEPLGYLSPVHRSGSEVTSGTDVKDEQYGQELKHEDPCVASKNIVDEPASGPSELHSSALEDTSAKDETPKPQVFHGAPDKSPTKLKIQDSAQQSEPILVPENQELDLLRASDIRATYDTKASNTGSEVENEQAQVPKDEIMPSADSNTVIQKSFDQDALTSVDEKIAELEKATDTLKAQLQDVKATETTTFDALNEAATYCVLAYDPSTQQVTRADTASSLSSADEILHPTQVLPRLNNPAKFVTHFDKMQKDGYEIVSGGGDILVFRKFAYVDAGRANQTSTEDNAYKMTGADVLSDPQVLEYMAASSPGLSSGPTETEPPPRKEESGIRKTLYRMVFTGTATAATCYAIGVVTEYFRTGGQDGRGIDGFTTFESDRRRRD